MTSLLTKALIGVGVSTAVVGSGGYGIYYFATFPKTIGEKLVRDGLESLNFVTTENSDESIWTAKLGKYKDEKFKNFRFDDLPASADSQSSLTSEKLKEKCKKAVDMSLSEEKANSTLDKVKKWCFKKTIEGE